MRRSAFLFAPLLAAVASSATPAAGDGCRLCAAPAGAEGSAEVGRVAVEVETSLDFDRLVLLAPSGGTARLKPDGSGVTSGSVAGLTGRAMVCSVAIRGEPGRPVRVDLPRRIELSGLAGGTISIDRIETDLEGSPRLDANGRLFFRFGGELEVRGDADGDYRGEIAITVEYL